MRRSALPVCAATVLLLASCGAGGAGLNQTSVTCPAGRTLLDGVCVAESVADYVACVRAQGASLGGSKAEKISAEVGTMGVKAGGAHEVRENMERKYSVSSSNAELEIIRACASKAGAGSVSGAPCTPGKQFSGFQQNRKCPDERDVVSLGDRGSKDACLAACMREPKAAGCWYLDGTGGFPRECRVCATSTPVSDQYANDWAGSFTTTPCK